MEFYNRPPSQDSGTDELFFKELRDTSRSVVLVLRVIFTCQILTRNTTQLMHKDPGDSFKHLGDNFLVQVVRELMRQGVVLDLLLINSEGLMREKAARDHLRCCHGKISQLFFNGLGNLRSSQLIGNWQTSQFSRRVRKKTLVITGLSASIRCLAKLQT